MIKKIIKNRRQIVEGIAMVSAVYVLIVINSARMVYGKNEAFSRNN